MNPRIRNRCRRSFFVLVVAAVTSTSSIAFADSLRVPQIQIGKPIDADYHCPGGKRFRVTYFNGSNGQSFALLPVDGVPTLMVSTVAASGVRYQSGFVTWWSKGSSGDFYDTRVDPEKPVMQGCTSK